MRRAGSRPFGFGFRFSLRARPDKAPDLRAASLAHSRVGLSGYPAPVAPPWWTRDRAGPAPSRPVSGVAPSRAAPGEASPRRGRSRVSLASRFGRLPGCTHCPHGPAPAPGTPEPAQPRLPFLPPLKRPPSQHALRPPPAISPGTPPKAPAHPTAEPPLPIPAQGPPPPQPGPPKPRPQGIVCRSPSRTSRPSTMPLHPLAPPVPRAYRPAWGDSCRPVRLMWRCLPGCWRVRTGAIRSGRG